MRHSRPDGPPEVLLFGGYFRFASPHAALLVALLPGMIHRRGIDRLPQLVRLPGDEALRQEAGRDLIVGRLVEMLLIEALRAHPVRDAPPGFLKGLADPRLAVALRTIHADASHAWTVADLADAAGMSRSAFFDRITCNIGMHLLEYLLAWRMAPAKDMLRGGSAQLDEVPRKIGYGSARALTTAVSRLVGQPPGQFMRVAALTIDPVGGPLRIGPKDGTDTMLKPLTLLLVLAANGVLADGERITDADHFRTVVTGKTLSRPLIRLRVSPAGAITGTGASLAVAGRWTWENGYFCRDLSWGGDDLGHNCQEVRVNGTRIRFTSDKGAGQSAEFRLSD